MSILNKKNEKKGRLLAYKEYSSILKYEIFNFFSNNVDKIISINNYDEAIKYTETLVNRKYGIPLKLKEDVLNINNFLITNKKSEYKNFFTHLKEELKNCESFYFIVSFIRFSGVQILIDILDELKKENIKGKIITSVYLNITEPKALKKLSEYENIDIKIYNNPNKSFHTKAFLFKRKKHNSCIIGSSNLSQSALYSGEEWNVRLADGHYHNIFSEAYEEFYKIWDNNNSIPLNKRFIDLYEEFQIKTHIKSFDFNQLENKENRYTPNKMQESILKKLILTRKFGNKKGVVIAATGTGKTYLAAMDILEVKPKSFLFIAHREELLKNAYEVFLKILPYKKENYGFLTGNSKDFNKLFLFSTVQSLQKKLENFPKKHFKYIIVDEFHHSKASTYESVLTHFDSEFLLGLTATPERMDGKNILELCDYNIIGEMSLRDALEKDLLSPFHYFGISDTTVNYDNIPFNNGKYDSDELENNLSISKRVDLIHNKIQKIGYDGSKIKAVAFCVNIKHAEYMKKEFLLRGYNAKTITALDNYNKREAILSSFREGNIEILCVVDIFNEGIDIPDVNLLLFLRPTMSSTIFIQQLGRGLRKANGKDFVTILDFIGNYKKDYIVAKAFSKYSFNEKNKMLLEIKNNFSNIPGASYIHFDRICQDRIIRKIENYNYSDKNTIISEYFEFKNEIDKIPEVIDFRNNINLFLRLKNKFGSFIKAQKIIENLEFNFSSYEEKIFCIIEDNFIMKYPYEVIIIWLLSNRSVVFISDIVKKFETTFSVKLNYQIQKDLIVRSMRELSEKELFVFNEKNYSISLKKISFTKNFIKRLTGLIELFILNFKKETDIEEFNNNILLKYKNYSRNELQILLDSRAKKGSWRAGYSVSKNHICLFITLNKSYVKEEHLRYDNYFYRQDIIQWISQSKTSSSSKVGQMYIHHKKLNYKVHIFIRKYNFLEDKSTSPFCYLGEAEYYSSHGEKPIYILWKLENLVPNNLFLEYSI